MRILQKVHDLTGRKAGFTSFFNTVFFNLNALDPEMFKLCYSGEDHILSLQILLSLTLKMDYTNGISVLETEVRQSYIG